MSDCFFLNIRNLFIWIWLMYSCIFLRTRMFSLPWIWGKPLFPVHSGQCFHVRGAVFSVHMRNFFPWIWYKTVFSGDLGQFYLGNVVRGDVFSVHLGNFCPSIWYKAVFQYIWAKFYHGNDVFSVTMRIFFHEYDLRLCFRTFGLNFFTMGMWPGGCVFCTYGELFSMDMI